MLFISYMNLDVEEGESFQVSLHLNPCSSKQVGTPLRKLMILTKIFDHLQYE